MAKQLIHPGKTIDTVTPEELAEALAQRDPNIVLGLGAGAGPEELNYDVPLKGTVRQATSDQRGAGSDNFIVPAAAFTNLVDRDPARIAGSVQNVGANPCFVYLATARRCAQFGFQAVGGIFVGYLAASGGSFDFKLSNDVWCGPVCVYSVLGTTLVWGIH